MVPDGGEPAIWRHGHSPLEDVVLEEVSRRPGMRAYVVGPEKAGDPGWAAFYAPVHLSGHRVGTLAAMRTRAEPFAREERQALVRLAGLGSLSFATERYKQQRAELARLQERQRIADDLHDDVAQILFAAQLNLDAILEREPATGEDAAGIERALGLLVRADTTIRKVIHQLSSSTSPEFDQRLAAAIARIEQEFSVAINLQLAPAAVDAANGLRRPAADALIKAAREATVNAAKHAGPCRIRVQLAVTERRRLLLSVNDDGVGGARDRDGAGHGLARDPPHPRRARRLPAGRAVGGGRDQGDGLGPDRAVWTRLAIRPVPAPRAALLVSPDSAEKSRSRGGRKGRRLRVFEGQRVQPAPRVARWDTLGLPYLVERGGLDSERHGGRLRGHGAHLRRAARPRAAGSPTR